MTTHFNNGLLRVARQRQGFAQGEAADRLGLPQPTLSRYENGLTVPGEDFFARASIVYDIPTSFFFQPDAVFGAPVSVHPMWRKKADVTTREMDKIVAELNIRAMHIRRMLEAVEFTPQATIPRLDPEEYGGDIEKIVGIVRAHWLIPNGPFQNLTAAAERAGVIVVSSSLGGSAVSGVTISIPGVSPIVILNSEQPSDRARFTLAHELGHIVMHRFPNPNMENEANDFASALLMPAHEIRMAFAGRVDLPRLAALKPEWKVSMQALLYRAQSLGIIEKNQARYLWQQINIQKIKFREPPELDFPSEIPGVLNRMIRLHIDTFGYSVAEMARMLHMHEAHLNQYYDFNTVPEKPPAGLRLRIVK